MPSTQIFANAYELNSAPTNGGTFTFKNSGSKTNVTLSETANTATGSDSNLILGDVSNDIAASTINNSSATYWGIGTVGGVQGIIVLENGNKYYFLTSQTLATGSTGASGTAAQSTASGGAGTNTWTLAGDGTPSAPTFAVSDDAGSVQSSNLPASSSTDDTTLTLSGTAGAGAVIRIYDGATTGTPIGTVTANSNGTWSYTTSGLSQGGHTLNVTQTNTAGTTSSATGYAVTVDTTAPGASTLGVVTDSVVPVTGTLISGGSTNDTDLSVRVNLPSGVVANDTIRLYNGTDTANPLGTAYNVTASDIANGFAVVQTGNLANGSTYQITARVTDAAGNQSVVSTNSFAATVDTVAPTAGATAGALSADNGTSGSDFVTNVAAQTVSGTYAGTLGSGEKIQVSADGSSWVDATANTANQTWSAGVTLAAGNGTLSVRTVDAAGNVLAGTGRAYTLDTAAPTVGSVAFGAHNGNLSLGESVTITVTASEALTVNTSAGSPTLALSGGAVATFTGVSGNVLTFTYTPTAGQNIADLEVTGLSLNGATVRDAAGGNLVNSGVSTTGSGIAVDTSAPSAPAIGFAFDDAGPVTGTLNAGGVTDDTTPTLTIGLPGNAVAGDTVRVFDGSTLVGSHVLTTADIGAQSASVATSAVAGDGTKTLTATITDAAGNASGAGSFGYTLDTTAPASGGAVALSNPGGDGVQYGEANVYAFDVSGVSGGTATVTFTSSGGGSPIVISGLGNGPQTVNLAALASGTITATISVSDAAGNATGGTGGSIEAVICFYPGTLVATPAGDRAVETLAAGDLVLTAEGEAKPIRWLGRQTVSTRFADPLSVLPVRIMAGALGEALPKRDLLVSPDHALLVDGTLVQAGALVNGTTVHREAGVPEVFTYWHVELADHSLVLAEGVPAETFVDNVARLAFDNWDEHEAAGSEAPIAEMALPRAKSARQVPAATKRRLADRAALLLGEQTAAA